MIHIVDENLAARCDAEGVTPGSMALTLASAEIIATGEGVEVCGECRTSYLSLWSEEQKEAKP